MSQNLGTLPSPLTHNVTLRRSPPPAPLTCDVIYGWPLISQNIFPFVVMANNGPSIIFFYVVHGALCRVLLAQVIQQSRFLSPLTNDNSFTLHSVWKFMMSPASQC